MWLFGPAQGLPAGSYAAQGNRGQYIMVIPSAKLVLVRRGEDPRRRPLRHREVQRRYPGGDSMNDWDAVVAFALTLPATELSTSYGQPALKVDGKAFASTGREPGSFHVRSPHEEKAILLDTDPDTFWQTAHYANWPGLLVRHGSADPERVELVLFRAWWGRGEGTDAQAPRRAAMRRFANVAVIDWSGQSVARPKGLALAHAAAGTTAPALLRPDGGWSRQGDPRLAARPCSGGNRPADRPRPVAGVPLRRR